MTRYLPIDSQGEAVKPWRGQGGSELVIIDARRLHSNRWGSLGDSQEMPAQSAAWADSPIKLGIGAALIGALVGLCWGLL
jgi:hypothetical protein